MNRKKWLQRRTPLRSKTYLQRRTEMRRYNPERRAKLFVRNYGEDGKHAAWVRAKGCAVHDAGGPGCWGRPVAAHAPSKAGKGDVSTLAHLCWGHHEEQGQIGIPAFNEKYGIDLEQIARDNWAESPHNPDNESETDSTDPIRSESETDDGAPDV